MIDLDIRQKVDQIAECICEMIKKDEEESFGLYFGTCC